MPSIRLIAVDDEYDSRPGLAIKGVRRADDFMAERVDGTLIAHDVLEHVNGIENIGFVWDELEALGAIWEVRGRHGDLQSKSIHTPHVNLASDVTRMFGDWRNEDGAPFLAPTRRCVYDDDFTDILNIAATGIPKEHEDIPHGLIGCYLTVCRDRMRTGFRKARNRYRGGYSTGYDMFSHIRQAVARVIPEIAFEGQEFVLTYSRRDAMIREVFQDAY
jgi:hypothetical protein